MWRTFRVSVNMQCYDYRDLQKSVSGHHFVHWTHWQLACSIRIVHGRNIMLSLT